MRIVHLANYFIPDSGYQEPYLARHQAEAGHEVHVITSNRAYPKHGDYRAFADIFPSRVLPPSSAPHENFMLHRLPATLEMNMQLLLRGVFGKLKEIRPDIVFAHGLSRFETLRLALWKKVFEKRFTLVVDDHMLYSVYDRTWYRSLYHGIFNHLLHRAELVDVIDHVVPVSQETGDFLREVFRVPESKITMIPLGADCDRFRFDTEARSQLRARLGLEEDHTVIIYAGKLIQQKGLDLLYDACREHLASRDDLRLLLVGSGGDQPFARQIQEQSREDGIEDKIVWCGHVSHEELAGYYSAADLAIWPLQETMAAIEAASASLPLILRNSKVSRERTAGGNGLNCETIDDLKAAVGTLSRDRSLCRDMGERGARYVREHFDWKVLAQRFVDVALESRK